MDPLTTIEIIQALMSFAGQVPELISAGKTTIDLLQSGAEPTAEQKEIIDAGLDAANKALQNS